MKKLLAAVALVAVAVVCAVVGLPAEEAHAGPPLAVVEALPAGSAAGAAENPFLAAATVSDATGITSTVTTAASTFPILKSATLLVSSRNTGGVTFSATNGTWTVDTGAAGAYEIIASASDVIGANSAIVTGQLFKNSTAIGNTLRKVEPATAARSNLGTAIAVLDLAAGDVISFKYDSNTNGDTVITRQFSFSMRRVAHGA